MSTASRLSGSALVAVCLVALGLWAPAADAEGPSLPGLDGGSLASTELDRGTVVVVIWASWSPRCRDIDARIAALESRWGSRARIVSVVFQEEPDVVRAFLRNRKMRAPVFLDTGGDFSKKHAVTSLPGLLVFRDGENLFRGKMPANPDALLERSLG